MKGSFVKIPNLPYSRAVLCAVQAVPEIVSALNGLGIECISLKSSVLPAELCQHSDMLLCYCGEGKIYAAPGQTHALRYLADEGFSISVSSPLGREYPEDSRLNIAVGGSFFVYNKKSADACLAEELEKSGKVPVAVRQGYTKCSLCFVAENAVVTEDISISRALAIRGTDVLTVSKGGVYLSDRHCGFFGGASGKIDRHTLAVTGSLKDHPDGREIRFFCKKHGVDILELSSGRLTDIGGILPLKETKT